MSFRGSITCVVHILTFRNVDIVTAGLYRLQVQVRQEQSPLPATALTPNKVYRSTGRHCVGEPRIAEVYWSNAFVVAYADEEVRIGDVVEFTGECSGVCSDLELVVQLQHCSSYSESAVDARISPPDSAFIGVATTVVKAVAGSSGIHGYCDALFPDSHFSLLSCVLHAAPSVWDFVPSQVEGVREVVTVKELLFAEVEIVRKEQVEKAFDENVFPLLQSLQTAENFLTSIKRRPEYRSFPHSSNPYRYDESLDSASLRQASLAAFTQLFTSPSAEEVADCVLEQMQSIAKCHSALLPFFRQLATTQPETDSAYFREVFDREVQALYDKSVIKDCKTVDAVPLVSDAVESLHSQVGNLRKEIAQLSVPRLQSANYPSVHTDPLPILYEESYVPTVPTETSPPCYGGTFVYVLVSGYGGSSADVRTLRNFVGLNYPTNSLFLTSRANDGKTDKRIEEMGDLLAREVRGFVEEQCKFAMARLTFIGHSLGGLIIRAALPFLQEYREKMHAYISFSTPHLGLMYSKSTLMRAGIWILESFLRSRCLKQLKMKDNSALPKTLLYQLSGQEGLNWFKHVVFFSSKEDKYAPLESARAELSERAQSCSAKGCCFLEMVNRLVGNLDVRSVRRVAVDFGLSEGSLGRMLGRKAHIEFIENRLFMMEFCLKFPELFQ